MNAAMLTLCDRKSGGEGLRGFSKELPASATNQLKMAEGVQDLLQDTTSYIGSNNSP